MTFPVRVEATEDDYEQARVHGHAQVCPTFSDVLGSLIILAPDENRYAISNGQTYQTISCCPICGEGLRNPGTWRIRLAEAARQAQQRRFPGC